MAMGSAMCGHSDLHIFDAKMVVYGWRTGPEYGASKPSRKNTAVEPGNGC